MDKFKDGKASFKIKSSYFFFVITSSSVFFCIFSYSLQSAEYQRLVTFVYIPSVVGFSSRVSSSENATRNLQYEVVCAPLRPSNYNASDILSMRWTSFHRLRNIFIWGVGNKKKKENPTAQAMFESWFRSLVSVWKIKPYVEFWSQTFWLALLWE